MNFNLYYYHQNLFQEVTIIENLAVFEANGFVLRVVPEGTNNKDEPNIRKFALSSPDLSVETTATTNVGQVRRQYWAPLFEKLEDFKKYFPICFLSLCSASNSSLCLSASPSSLVLKMSMSWHRS